MTNNGFSRRRFVQTALAGAVAGVAARSGVRLAYADSVYPTADLAPDDALQQLLDGNRRFASNQMTSFKDDLADLRKQTVEKQEPFAAVLACADSRVPVELLFDQSIGRIFVARIAGNFVTPEIIASLEYGVAVLGVRALLVLGHTNCGAVKAAMKSDAAPGQISALYSHIRPAIDQSAGKVDSATEINARLQADLLRTSSTVIRKAAAGGTLKVVSGVYDLATGEVTMS